MALAFGALGLVAPALFLAGFILIRPLTDGLSNAALAGGLNTAGAIGVLAIVVAGALLCTRSNEMRVPAAAKPFLVLIALSTLAALLAILDLGNVLGSEPLTEVTRLVALLAVYFLGQRLSTTTAQVHRLFALVGLSAVPPAIVGIHEWVTGVTPSESLGFGRIDGTFFGPNPFATYLALAALILIATPRETLRPSVRVVALVPILVALLGSYSRTGWAFFLLGLIFLEWRRRRTLLAIAAAACVVISVAVPTVRERVLSVTPFSAETVQSADARPNSFAWRVDNWGQLVRQYSERPITGYGLRTTELVNPNRTGRSPEARTPDNPAGSRGFSAHNSFVRPLVEGGPLLLSAYVFLLGALVLAMHQVAKPSWPLQAHARLLMFLWLLVAIIGLTSTDALNLTALMSALLALTGAVEGAWADQGEAKRGPAA